MATSVVIPPGYGNASFKWTFLPSGRQFISTMGYHDDLGTGNAAAAAGAYYGYLTGAGKPVTVSSMFDTWRFDGVSVLQRTLSNMLIVAQTGPPITGTITGSANQNPVFTTLVVSKNSAFAGRAYRGRMYPPLLVTQEASVNYAGVLDPAQVTAYQTQWNLFMTGATSGSWPAHLLHATDIHGVTPLPTPLQSLTVRSIVGIQRRRRA